MMTDLNVTLTFITIRISVIQSADSPFLCMHMSVFCVCVCVCARARARARKVNKTPVYCGTDPLTPSSHQAKNVICQLKKIFNLRSFYQQ